MPFAARRVSGGGYCWASRGHRAPESPRSLPGCSSSSGRYLSLLRRLVRRDEAVVYAPEFRRTLDEPVAASIAIPAEVPLVITEGNYLLFEQEPWKDIRAQLDEVWFVDVPPALRLNRLVERHISFGMERAAAEAWAAGPDQANAVLIEATRPAASRIIPWH